MADNEDQNLEENDDTSADAPLTELVAYLDGELNSELSERLEKQLAADPPLRRTADDLDRTWQLLDVLGDASASGEFAKRTMASLAAIQKTTNPESGAAGRWRRWLPHSWQKLLIIAGTGFVAASAGLVIARQQPPKVQTEDLQLLRDLPLFRDYSRVYSIPDSAFLQEMAKITATSGKKDQGQNP